MKTLNCFLASLLILGACASPQDVEPKSIKPFSIQLPEAVTTLGNTPPYLQALSSQPTQFTIGTPVTFTVQGFDVESESLTYTWSSSNGTLQNKSGESVTWLPENNGQPINGLSIITVVASDGQQSVKGDFNVFIQDNQGVAEVVIQSVGEDCPVTVAKVEKQVDTLIDDNALPPASFDVSKNRPTAGIKIDGEVDDWAGVLPVIQDSSRDTGGEGDDIKALYLFQDSTYLYYRIDTWGTPDPNQLNSHISVGTKGSVFLDPRPKAEEKISSVIEGKIPLAEINQSGQALKYYVTAFIPNGDKVADRTRVVAIVDNSAVAQERRAYEAEVKRLQAITLTTDNNIKSIKLPVVDDGSILIDGQENDWSGIPVAVNDPIDAVLGAVDIVEVSYAVDSQFLYAKIKTKDRPYGSHSDWDITQQLQQKQLNTNNLRFSVRTTRSADEKRFLRAYIYPNRLPNDTDVSLRNNDGSIETAHRSSGMISNVVEMRVDLDSWINLKDTFLWSQIEVGGADEIDITNRLKITDYQRPNPTGKTFPDPVTPNQSEPNIQNPDNAIPEITIPQVPDGSIQIDGKFEDWGNPQPSYRDPLNDSNGPIDFSESYYAMDSQYLYYAQKVNGGTPISVLNGLSGEDGGYNLYIENPSLASNSIAEARVFIGTGNPQDFSFRAWQWVNDSPSDVTRQPLGGINPVTVNGNMGFIDEIVEMRIDRSLIGDFNGLVFKPEFRFFSGNNTSIDKAEVRVVQ